MPLLKYLLRLPGLVPALVLVLACLGPLGLAAWGVIRPGIGYAAAAAAPAFVLILALPVAYSHRGHALFLAGVLLKLRRSLPNLRARPAGPLFESPVTLEQDRFGVPTITARSRPDAFRALGFVHARDRLFQMDLGRREAAGRLSEIFGPSALGLDLKKREMGFVRAAEGILAALPARQSELLRAYAEGVNAFVGQARVRPFEFLFLGYEPEPWGAGDSVLVMLRMFDLLCGEDRGERMLTVMRETLPPEVFAFLTPDADCYGEVLSGGAESRRPAGPIPVGAMSSLLAGRKGRGRTPPRLARTEEAVAGSNCWAVGKSKTADGRAVLSNDIHLSMGVPNVWYRAKLCYEGMELSGVMTPGVPLVLAGANRHVAWGVTNLRGDCLDLVPLRVNPDNESEYMTPGGWKRFDTAREVVGVKGREPVVAEFRHTVWGPVSSQPLLGEQVATQWTALRPDGVDFGLMDVDAAANVEEAVDVISRFAGPPMNALVADDRGRIGYTVCGRLPLRRGFDGSSAQYRGDGAADWEGYVPAAELPRLFDPPSGYLVSANNRAWGRDYPHVLGQDFCGGYRARRISERLRGAEAVDERDMFDLQLDAACDLYEFYRGLALSVLTEEAVSAGKGLGRIRGLIESWDGRAEVRSDGIVFLMGFREMLTRAVFTPFLERCGEADESFVYRWQKVETPLRMMLTEKPPELLPDPERYEDWDSFILGTLEEGVGQVRKKYRLESPDGLDPAEDLRWGSLNRAIILHPLTPFIPALKRLLSMPHDPLRGSLDCVCVSSPTFGSTARVVVSPGRPLEGLCQMPCGQSGHPLSPNYRDQHDHWARQEPLPFAPGPARHKLVLEPAPRRDA